MAARIRSRTRSQAERLRRLAVVFAVEVRLRIVVEAYQREVSPKQFFEEHGGGSLSRVARNFDRLLGTGWLRHMRSEGPGGDRRGGVEHFYRATELAFLDRETWAALPYSVRVAFSWRLFRQIAIWLREGVEAKILGSRPGSDLTSRRLTLDRLGWERAIAAVAEVFASIFEEQDDARVRAARSGEKLIRVSVLQLVYESPAEDAERSPSDLLVEIPEPLIPLLVRASRVFPDELCMEIIGVANERAISATEFHQEFGGDIGKVRRRFRKAAENGWLTEVAWKTGGRRRGATEKFYRATRPAAAQIDEFVGDIPNATRATKAGKEFERICADFTEAMKAETLDARTDRYVALSLLQLDREGWKRVVAALRDLWAALLEEQREARARPERSGEESIATTVVLGVYETPRVASKEP